MRKLKKYSIFVVYLAILAALFSSCAIDRACPAYTAVKINSNNFDV